MKTGKGKGEKGNINIRRIRVTVLTLLMYICSIGIFILGVKLTGTRRNLLTVAAILGILPASKSLVNMIMLLRFKSVSDDLFRSHCDAAGSIPVIYELPFTTYEKTFFVEAVSCVGSTLSVCYITQTGKKSPGYSGQKKLKEHLEGVLKNDGFSDFTIKIFENRDDYFNRLSEINQKGLTATDEDRRMLDTLKAVSL
ncbi:MAG: hypothetical protein K6F34_10270 [Lachnospiraceae bacterium]|nr:hypothetical protein [Lachnospiraceae bacterium]